jgi:hypothetical protein
MPPWKNRILPISFIIQSDNIRGGAVSLKGHVIDRQEYDTIIKEIKLGLPMISVFTVDNIKILSENTESLDGDTKVKNSNRVELRESMYIKEVWAGDNSYIVTLDNKRYWENSILRTPVDQSHVLSG